ncbi:MAG TPA: NADH-quinone oxidoreductase subunit C [Myxococcales bacterium]
MTPTDIRNRLAAKFGDKIADLAPAKMDPFLVIQPKDLKEICRYLKDDKELDFDCLMNLSAIDWPKKNQIELVYHLWSYPKRHAFIFKFSLPREAPEVESIESVWKSADWLEREQFDLVGVVFKGHPDLRRIMLPDDWVGHPLRKDYKEQGAWHNISTTRESPLEGYIRIDDFKKKAADAAAAQVAAAAPKKEVLQ